MRNLVLGQTSVHAVHFVSQIKILVTSALSNQILGRGSHRVDDYSKP